MAASTRCANWRARLWTALCLLSWIAGGLAQNTATYSALAPSAPAFSSGAFLSPLGTTDVFQEGAFLNITWNATKFNSYNLYLIRGKAYNQPIDLELNYYKPWYYWQINGAGDLSKPFSFRIVNAAGTTQDKEVGGFESEPFWITPAPGTNATQTSSTSTLPTLHTTTIANAVAPSSKSTGTGKRYTHAATALNTSQNTSGLSTGAEVGIGVGVGVAGTALILLGAFFLWRRSRQKKKRKQAVPLETPMASYQRPNGYTDDPARAAQSPPTSVHEVSGTRDPVEMPITERHELPGDPRHSRHSNASLPLSASAASMWSWDERRSLDSQ